MADDTPSPVLADCAQEDQPVPRTPATDPCVMVIFGASGDLTHRLILPALYNLSRARLLPERFALVGAARSDGDANSWRESLRKGVADYIGPGESVDDQAWARLADRLAYVPGDLTDQSFYGRLSKAIEEAARQHQTGGNVLFYLAVADSLFGPVVEQLAGAKLTKEGRDGDEGGRFWRRVVVEKPFGHSLSSARELDARIRRVLEEDQVYRIDHFLGKETVQSIMALRFANGLFEPIWNRDRIDHVQITASETVGVEQRGKFYEATGALRDMTPNHALSLISMVTMEPPVGFDAKAIQDRKTDVFAAMPAVKVDQAVRGQYGPGEVSGAKVVGYRQEPDVDPQSDVETFVALRFEVDNWRWAGVPFYFRTGKHMSARTTEIAIRFKQAPYAAFEATPVDTLRPNWLVLRIAPDEGVSLQFEVKRPGPAMSLAAVNMDFRYRDWFAQERNVGYETLIYDVMVGDQTLFMRADMVEQGWRIIQPVLDAWAAEAPDGFPNYPSGSDGPGAADALLARDGGRCWRPILAAQPVAAGAKPTASVKTP